MFAPRLAHPSIFDELWLAFWLRCAPRLLAIVTVAGRAVRPEAYGGLAHHRLANGVRDYPLHDNFVKSEALDRSKAKYGTYLLSQTYPEASPLHSTYPGGATAVGAVTATILKAFFDESRVIANPVQPVIRLTRRGSCPMAARRSRLVES
jgi:hypothetical protein